MTKALSLHQPWAQLVAEGVKTIETRSWSTSYRGPLVIHAGKAKPKPGMVGEFEVNRPRGVAACLMDYRPDDGDGLRRWSARTHVHRLPLGFIVASCTLADVVPIVAAMDEVETWPYVKNLDEPGLTGVPDGWKLTLSRAWGEYEDATDQRPYGDFTPGRYAWLLEDVKPTTERCPQCWGTGTVENDYLQWRCGCGRGVRHVADCGRPAPAHIPCPTCYGRKGCNPIPWKGKQRLFEVNL